MIANHSNGKPWNVVIWARVSSREQREGYSIDAQLRADREKARREGWNVVREFELDESAKRGAERKIFNEMFRWVKANAKRNKINAILCHKLDRICRNMRDAVRLQDLEDTCGVRLCFVENEFGPGAAGTFSFNVMAAVAQYYSDNLREEVLKGLDERVRQGWPTGLACYGYRNVKGDREQPVQPHPVKSKTVIRIFELYSTARYTFESLADQLAQEGHIYRKSQPRFHRTALSYILNNRFYIGEIKRRGRYYQGKHQPLIDRATFQTCQDILNGKNRRYGNPEHPFSGGLFRCAFCGQSLTGERIRRKLKGGGVREHLYYRCANNRPGPDHPKVRWKADDLEEAVIDDLQRLKLPSQRIAELFRDALESAFADIDTHQRRQTAALSKRQSELKTMQDRLLSAYLEGTVEEKAFREKSAQLVSEEEAVREREQQLGDFDPARGKAALAVFDFSQNAAEIWRGSNIAARREILESVCLNRTLTDATLVTTKRKPFDALAKRPILKKSRGDWI